MGKKTQERLRTELNDEMMAITFQQPAGKNLIAKEINMINADRKRRQEPPIDLGTYLEQRKIERLIELYRERADPEGRSKLRILERKLAQYT